MDLLQESNLLLQALNASLQVQPGQSGIVNILDTNTETQINIVRTNKEGKRVQEEQETERMKVVDERHKRKSCAKMECFTFHFGI